LTAKEALMVSGDLHLYRVKKNPQATLTFAYNCHSANQSKLKSAAQIRFKISLNPKNSPGISLILRIVTIQPNNSTICIKTLIYSDLFLALPSKQNQLG